MPSHELVKCKDCSARLPAEAYPFSKKTPSQRVKSCVDCRQKQQERKRSKTQAPRSSTAKRSSAALNPSYVDRDHSSAASGSSGKLPDRVFQRSPTPQEWEDDSDREWPVQAVVDHYTPAVGPRSFKFAWADWERADGTNTTWTEDDSENVSIAEYKLHRRTRISKDPKDEVIREQDVNPSPMLVQPNERVHGLAFRTVESRLARRKVSEKRWKQLERLAAQQSAEADRQKEIADTLFGPNPLFAKLRPSDEMEVEDSNPSDSDLFGDDPVAENTQTRSATAESIQLDDPLFMDFSYHSPPTMEAGSASDSGSPAAKEMSSETLPTAPPEFEETRLPMHAGLNWVQPVWDEVTSAAGAEPIVIINDGFDPTDDDNGWEEDCPALPKGFEYIESGYSIDSSIWAPTPDEERDITLGCRCEPECDMEEEAICACQSFSDFNGTFAYDNEGFFLSNNKDEADQEAEVFECSVDCHCSDECPNRTSQRPRDTSLEVFKTRSCGWGVRTPIDLPPGKVLGTFTGTLITRSLAETLERSRRAEWAEYVSSPDYEPEEDPDILDRRGYIFDLDLREHVEVDPQEDSRTSSPGRRAAANRQKFSVDAWAKGNWSRFLNHSCKPNLKVYTAIVDPYDADNPPPGRLVFYTIRRIREGEELTIDYNPGLKDMGKGRQRRTRHKGSMNLIEMSRRTMSQAGPKDEPEEENMVDAAPGYDEIRCDCDSSNCRGFIRI